MYMNNQNFISWHDKIKNNQIFKDIVFGKTFHGEKTYKIFFVILGDYLNWLKNDSSKKLFRTRKQWQSLLYDNTNQSSEVKTMVKKALSLLKMIFGIGYVKNDKATKPFKHNKQFAEFEYKELELFPIIKISKNSKIAEIWYEMKEKLLTIKNAIQNKVKFAFRMFNKWFSKVGDYFAKEINPDEFTNKINNVLENNQTKNFATNEFHGNLNTQWKDQQKPLAVTNDHLTNNNNESNIIDQNSDEFFDWDEFYESTGETDGSKPEPIKEWTFEEWGEWMEKHKP